MGTAFQTISDRQPRQLASSCPAACPLLPFDERLNSKQMSEQMFTPPPSFSRTLSVAAIIRNAPYHVFCSALSALSALSAAPLPPLCRRRQLCQSCRVVPSALVHFKLFFLSLGTRNSALSAAPLPPCAAAANFANLAVSFPQPSSTSNCFFFHSALGTRQLGTTVAANCSATAYPPSPQQKPLLSFPLCVPLFTQHCSCLRAFPKKLGLVVPFYQACIIIIQTDV